MENRIQQLTELKDKLDKRFVEMYGEDHRAQVLAWYKRVQNEGSFAEK